MPQLVVNVGLATQAHLYHALHSLLACDSNLSIYSWAYSYSGQESIMFHSGYYPCSVDGQRPLSVHLHIGIGVAHLGNQQVQQYHNDQAEKCQVNDHTKPPARIRRQASHAI